MARIPKANTAEERSSDGVSLLISILVRFPQIGTIHFESKNRILRLNFMLARSLSPAEISEVQTKMAEHIKAYHHVTGRKPSCVNFECKQPYEKFCIFSLLRDLASLSKGELSLLISMITERFHDCLIMDDQDNLPDFMDDPGFPDDIIDSMMENVRFQRTAKNLTAMRENGRVLVFNK